MPNQPSVASGALLKSQTLTGVSATASSSHIDVRKYRSVLILWNVTAISVSGGGKFAFRCRCVDEDGNETSAGQGADITTTGTSNQSFGNAVGVELGNTIAIEWKVTDTCTFSAKYWVYGK